MLLVVVYYAPVANEDKSYNPNWCGLHRENGLLILKMEKSYNPNNSLVARPKGSGLYIRGYEIVAPTNALLFQIGESAELITNGEIVATEHWVKKAYGGYSRYSLALFCDVPADTVINSTVTKYNDRYKPNMIYGEWSEASYNKI